MNELDRMLNRQAAKGAMLRNTAEKYRRQARQAEAAHDAQGAANWNALADQMVREYNQTIQALKAFHPLRETPSLAEQNYLWKESEGKST